LELLGTVEELSHLEMAATGEANSQLWVVSLKNRVFGQYIILEASPESSDQNLWIQGILGTFRTFMVTPKKAHKSPNSWIGQIDLQALRGQSFKSVQQDRFQKTPNIAIMKDFLPYSFFSYTTKCKTRNCAFFQI
jgi:hypothetical protein